LSLFGNIAKAAKKVSKTVSKGATSAAKTVSHTASSAAKTVGHTASSAANAAAHTASSAAQTVGKGVTTAAHVVGHEADHMAKTVGHGKAMLCLEDFSKHASHAIGQTAKAGAQLAGSAGHELSKGLQTVITTGLAFGRDLEEVAEIYMEKGAQEISRLQKQTVFAVNLIRKMKIGQSAQRFGNEVVGPLVKHQISAADAAHRLNNILSMDVRQAAQQQGLGSCIAVGIEADAGLILGIGGAVGIVIDLHGGPVRGYGSVAGKIGAIEKVGGGLEVSWAPSSSNDFDGPSVGISLGGAYYVGLTVGVSTPLSTFADPLKKWQLDSITIGIPIGIGFEGDLTIEDTWCF